MACYHPLKAYRTFSGITFNKNQGTVPVTLACGQCFGCRLEYSRVWAMRCMHEATLHTDNCFITLTYDSEHIPPDSSLNLRHFQTFMKRLRKSTGAKIRYFHCGEYGDNFNRPHYHALLFGYDFADKMLLKKKATTPFTPRQYFKKTGNLDTPLSALSLSILRHMLPAMS